MNSRRDRTYRITALVVAAILFVTTLSVGVMAVDSNTAYCIFCDGTHGFTLDYEYWTEELHSIRQWCDNCGKDQCQGGKAENHTYINGVCTKCGYDNGAGSSQCSHSYTYGDWDFYNSSTHRRLYSCSKCGEGTYEYAMHDVVINYTQHNESQHRKASFCPTCRNHTSALSYEEHSFSYTEWIDYSETQHCRESKCLLCGLATTDYSNHEDGNSDGSCDYCGRTLSCFSVTLPAALVMTMSEDGQIHTATNIFIKNNSSADVKISAITVNACGEWTLIPYAHNIAAEKVDSRLIGFRLNGAFTTAMGKSENLTLNGDWRIGADSALHLFYDAVVSANSSGYINEQVLTLVFVVDWDEMS